MACIARLAGLRCAAIAATAAALGAGTQSLACDGPFRRISTFPVFLNTDVDIETSAEIVAAANDGTLLVYTDAPAGVLGFVDIVDPFAPAPAGFVELGGDPTSVAVVGDLALVAVNTSRDFVNVSGRLVMVDVDTRRIVRTIELGGQPDSVAISPDQAYAAIVIENERDEELGEGEPPQLPPGFLVIVDLVGGVDAWTTRTVDLVGVATLFPEDPEPEFVDINADNLAVVTLQENNHIALVDLAKGVVVGAFEAGSVDLEGIDTVENDLIEQDSSLRAVPREPDAVAWISRRAFATANEGDLFGGSRGFTVFSDDGATLFDAGSALERLVARIGHYPEGRSENKGNEPEGAEVATFDGTQYLFIGSERSSVIAVYTNVATCPADLDGDGGVDGGDLGAVLAAWGSPRPGAADVSGDGVVDGADVAILVAAWGACAFEPELVQVLPTGVSPEGLLAIPQRDLLVAASEIDARADLIRSTISIYQRTCESTYPLIVSADRADGAPIPWAALSGLVVDPNDSARLFAIHDSFFASNRLYTMDMAASPATIDGELVLVDSKGLLAVALANLKASLPGTEAFDPAALVNADGTINLDPEGIAVASGGGWWIASEGAGNLVNGVSNPLDQPFRSPNALLHVDSEGAITKVALLPLELTLNQFRFGFEGVAAAEENGVEILYVAFQRRWAGTGDPANRARIGRFDTSTSEWTFAYYTLESPTSPNGGWVGLSEITHVGDGVFAVIERDNQGGPDARIKLVTSFSVAGLEFRSNGDAPALPEVAKTVRRDLIAAGDYDAGVILEKLEGMAVLPDGRTILVNDNDGVDDSSGETRLFDLGKVFGVGR